MIVIKSRVSVAGVVDPLLVDVILFVKYNQCHIHRVSSDNVKSRSKTMSSELDRSSHKVHLFDDNALF